jgi:nitrite reductase/ring-hydroxylating ferredoxin subunit
MTESESEFVLAGRVEDFAPGAMRVTTVNGREVVVTKIDGTFHAFADVCTHAFHPLSHGFISGREAVCIYHWAKFDATTGDVTQGPAVSPLQTFDVRIEDGQVLVGKRRE